MGDGKLESRSVWKLGDGGWYGRDLSLIKGEGKEGTFGALSYKKAKDLRRWNHFDSPLWSVAEQRVRDNSARDSALSHHFKSWLWIEKPWICATTNLLARSRYAEGWGWNIKINPKYSNNFPHKMGQVNITKHNQKSNHTTAFTPIRMAILSENKPQKITVVSKERMVRREWDTCALLLAT